MHGATKKGRSVQFTPKIITIRSF